MQITQSIPSKIVTNEAIAHKRSTECIILAKMTPLSAESGFRIGFHVEVEKYE